VSLLPRNGTIMLMRDSRPSVCYVRLQVSAGLTATCPLQYFRHNVRTSTRQAVNLLPRSVHALVVYLPVFPRSIIWLAQT